MQIFITMLDIFKIIQMKLKINYLLYFILTISPLFAIGQTTSIQPGEVWKDIDGKPINAHGGGFLFHKGKYYWYGEIKTGETKKVEYITSWECHRTKAGGVSCYSSDNLLDWKFEGVALPSKYR